MLFKIAHARLLWVVEPDRSRSLQWLRADVSTFDQTNAPGVDRLQLSKFSRPFAGSGRNSTRELAVRVVLSEMAASFILDAM